MRAASLVATRKALGLIPEVSAMVELSLDKSRCSWQLKTGIGDDTNLSVLDLGSVMHFLSLAPLYVLRYESSGLECPEQNNSTWLRENLPQKMVRKIILRLTLLKLVVLERSLAAM